MANNVGKAAELLKILTRVKKLEQEVRRNKQTKNHITFDEMKKISCVVTHGIETIRTQYEQMGETMDELKELAEELERFVDSEDEEVHTLDLTRFERAFNCEGGY